MHDKTEKIVAIENAILKLLKVLSSINNAPCVVLSFFPHLTLYSANHFYCRRPKPGHLLN